MTEKQKKVVKIIEKLLAAGIFSIAATAREANTDRATVREVIARNAELANKVSIYRNRCAKKPPVSLKRTIIQDLGKEHGTVTVRSLDIKTLDKALKIAKVNLSIWCVERYVINSWEVTLGATDKEKAQTVTNFQVKVWLKRITPELCAAEEILERLRTASPVFPKWPRKDRVKKALPRRELELSLLDPHLGLRCYAPEASEAWSPEIARKVIHQMLDALLRLSKPYAPFERIIFPFGNDFMHTDYVYQTTTTGTRQPEADAWKHVLVLAEELMIEMVERMKQVAPLKILVIPGNHAMHAEISLGRILKAYYHNDANVEVDASMAPYKFHHFGVNLIGFEHGHSVKNSLRLASLMANECRLKGWSEARFCEWHLGDQHRKGSAKPSTFEEQGVSVEYLPGLVPPNEWHKIHAYNWQKRAGMGFIWDHAAGPIARLQVNINNYNGKIMES